MMIPPCNKDKEATMKTQQPPMILDKKRSLSIQQEVGEEEEIVNNNIGGKRMKKENKTTKESLIPDYMIYEILLNLRVKSLLRFNSLSKHYNSLISSSGSSFIRDHANRSSSRCSLFIQTAPCTFNLTMLDYDSIKRIEEEEQLQIEKEVPPSRDVMFPVSDHGQERYGFDIQCCFHGIICFASSSDEFIGLWNLHTNEYKRLPQLFNFKRRRSAFGFGFDSSVNDYKIVRLPALSMLRRAKREPNPEFRNIFIMTLRSYTWRKIDVPFEYHIPLPQSAIPTPDGRFLYWFAKPRAEHSQGLCPCVIIAFDLIKETVIEVPLPPPLLDDEDDRLNLWLGLLQGCISFTSWNKSNNCFDFWMLQGPPAPTATWIKSFTFPLSHYKGLGHIKKLRPLFTTNNGAYVMHAGLTYPGSSAKMVRQQLIYDPSQGTCKHFQVAGVPHRKRYYMYSITESLVSFLS